MFKPRLSEPRILPLPESEWTDEQRKMLTSSRNPLKLLNVFRTLIRHPDLYRRFNQLAHQLLFNSSLSPRDRELVVLRVGFLCDSAYEFHQHSAIAKKSDISSDEIERVKVGPLAAGWSSREAALLKAVDELHGDFFVSSATWEALSREYDERQLMDLVFLAGNYTMLATALNTFGVQIED